MPLALDVNPKVATPNETVNIMLTIRPVSLTDRSLDLLLRYTVTVLPENAVVDHFQSDYGALVWTEMHWPSKYTPHAPGIYTIVASARWRQGLEEKTETTFTVNPPRVVPRRGLIPL